MALQLNRYCDFTHLESMPLADPLRLRALFGFSSLVPRTAMYSMSQINSIGPVRRTQSKPNINKNLIEFLKYVRTFADDDDGDDGYTKYVTWIVSRLGCANE